MFQGKGPIGREKNPLVKKKPSHLKVDLSVLVLYRLRVDCMSMQAFSISVRTHVENFFGAWHVSLVDSSSDDQPETKGG